jgi:hypothetical protein
MQIFMWKNGWRFQRLPAGDVVIAHFSEGKTEPDTFVEIDSDSWASIIANVSINGEGHENWYNALVFHNGPIYSDHFLAMHNLMVHWQGKACNALNCSGTLDYDHEAGDRIFFKCDRCGQFTILTREAKGSTSEQQS